MSIKISLLIDINCFPDVASWKEHNQNFQETVLERLFLDGSFNGEFDPKELVWAYQFYDSAGTNPSTSTKDPCLDKFWDFDRKSYEFFLKKFDSLVNTVYRDGPGPRPFGTVQNLSASMLHLVSVLPWGQDYRSNSTMAKKKQHVKSTTPSKDVLDSSSRTPADALTSSFDQEEQSPSHLDTSVATETGATQERNIIYVFTQVPRNSAQLKVFLHREWSAVTSSDTFSKILLGKLGYGVLRTPKYIQVKFVDTGYYKSNETEFNNIYPFPLPKVLATLGYAGCVVPSVKPHNHGKPGFPSWKNMLLEFMLASSANEPQKPEVFKSNPQISLNQPEVDKKIHVENDAASVCSDPTNPISISAKKTGGTGMMDSLMRGKIKTPYSQEQRIETKSKGDQYFHSQRKSLGFETSFSNTSISK